METLDVVGLAIAAALTGAVFVLAARLLLRLVPAMLSAKQPVDRDPSLRSVTTAGDLPADGSREAVLVIRPGGKILSLNDPARQLFGMSPQDRPGLERLARRVRPSLDFLNLCAAEGQARVSVSGCLMEATSYAILADDGPRLLVSLRATDVTAGLVAGTGMPNQTLLAFLELNQAMAKSLEVDTTLQAVLHNLEKLFPADLMMVTVWDTANQWLVPYRLEVSPNNEARLRRGGERYRLGEDISGQLLTSQSPLLVPDLSRERDVSLSPELRSLGLRGYMGVPLILGKEWVGTLEVGSLAAGTFRPEHLELLRLLSGQAAIAIHNAILYRDEQRRTTELSSLAGLTQAFGALPEPDDLYERLVQAILPLLPVEVLGFLLYSEQRRCLQARAPFMGIPGPLADEGWFQGGIPMDSQAEPILASQDVLITENAGEDSHWEHLGLAHLAQVAAIRDAVLVPLVSAGRTMGYLLAANHTEDSSAFTRDELHLLLIVANQAAIIIENADLVQDSLRRAQTAESLRRIAGLTSSAANLEEILKYSVQELASLMRSDMAAILLLDSPRQLLEVHRASLAGAPADYQPPAGLRTDDPQFRSTVTASRRPFLTGFVTLQGSDPATRAAAVEACLPDVYRPLVESLKPVSLVAVPLVVRDQGIGELWLGSSKPHAFDRGDLQVAATASGQLAGVIEQASLVAQTDERLRRRVEQLTAITRITRELSTAQDVNRLFAILHEECIATTRADSGAIILLDEDVPAAATPRVKYIFGDESRVDLSPIERRAIEKEETIVVRDTEADPGSYPVIAGAPVGVPSGARSAVLVPIRYRGRVAGVIHLQAASPDRFDDTAVEIIQTLALQAAVVLGNALEYQEQIRRSELLKRQVDTLDRLFQTAQALRVDQPLEQSLQAIATGIQEATPFKAVLISLVDEESGELYRVTSVGLTPDVWEELRSRRQPWRSLQQLLKPEFRTHNAYFIPIEQEPAIPVDIHMVTVLPGLERKANNAWDPDDMLLIPLYGEQENPLGLISLDAPADGLRPDRPTLSALEIFAIEAAFMIENYWRVESLKGEICLLRQDRERLAEQVQAAEVALPALNAKDAGQARAIERLEGQVYRIQQVVEILEQASQPRERQAFLHALAGEWKARMGMDAVLVAEDTPDGPRLVDRLGSLPGENEQEARPDATLEAGTQANLAALFGQRNPLIESFQTGEVALCPDLAAQGPNVQEGVAEEQGEAEGFIPDRGWRQEGLLAALEARGFICLPLRGDSGNVDASLLATSHRPLQGFEQADLPIFRQMARQAGILLQNIDLYDVAHRRLDEVRLLFDFSRKMSSLNLTRILETLLDSALHIIPGAQAGMVLLWDARTVSLIPREVAGYPAGYPVEQPSPAAESLMQIHMPMSSPTAGLALPVQVFLQGQLRRVDEVDLVRDYPLSQDDLLLYREGVGGRLPVSSLVAPIRTGNIKRGVVILDNFERQAAFTPEDEARITSLGQQAALALENARLFQAAEDRTRQLQALTHVAGVLSSCLKTRELIDSLLEQLAVVLPYDVGSLWLLQDGEMALQRAYHPAEGEEGLGLIDRVDSRLLFGEILKSGQPLLFSDYQSEAGSPDGISQASLQDVSWLGIPLLAKGEPSGIIALEKREADFYTSDQIQVAAAFAGQAAIALENARLYEETRRLSDELESRVRQRTEELTDANRETHALLHILTELSASLDMDQVLARTLAVLNDASGAQESAVWLVKDGEGGDPAGSLHAIHRLAAGTDQPSGENRAGWPALEQALARQVVQTRQPVILPGTPAGENETAAPERSADEPVGMEAAILQAGLFHSLAAVPLILGEDVLGSLQLYHTQPGFFTPGVLSLVQAAARQMSITIHNAGLYALIRDQAEHLGGMLRHQQIEASRSRAILEAVADGVLVTDGNNRITLLNASAAGILSLPAAQGIGQVVERMAGWTGPGTGPWIQTIQSWSKNPGMYRPGDSYHDQVSLANGRIAGIHLAPVIWRSDFLGTVTIMRDITREITADRLKSDFITNVSHELRTPLTSLRGYVELLLMGAAGDLSTGQRQHLEVIQQNTGRLYGLVENLLDISRLEAGRLALSQQPVDLAALAERVIQDARRRAREEDKPVTFRLELARGKTRQTAQAATTVPGDSERVVQILENLLSNAYRYTPAGGSVEVRVRPLETKVQVDVRDTGIGVPIAEQGRIFERFYRGEHPLVQSVPGAGLGLSIVKALVEMHQGQVWVSSSGREGEGSTFSFTLPRTGGMEGL